MQATTVKFAQQRHTIILVVFAAILAFALAAATTDLMPSKAHAATASGGAKMYTLKPNKLYTSYDITGDKRPDRIKVVTLKQQEGMHIGLKVIINGKTAYTNKKATTSGKPTVKLIRLKNGKPFLYLSVFEYNPSTDLSAVFSYRSGKLKAVIDSKKALGTKFGWDGTYGTIKKVSGNTITMNYSTSTYMFGAINATYKYTYKSGKLKATSTGTFKPSENRKSYKALMNIPVYKNTACTAKKFTIAAGDKVKFTNIYVKGNTVRVKVKVGAKTGWIKCATSPTSSLLHRYTDPDWDKIRYESPFENLG